MEQWEIDLRKQLDNKVVQEEPAKKNVTFALLLLVIILGFAVVFAYDQKTGGSIENWIKTKYDDCFNKSVCEKSEPPKVISNNSDLADIRNSISKLEESSKSNQDIVNKYVDRINLMGVMLNENFLIIANNNDRSKLIFFNRDWTLDRMPSHIKLSEEDKEFLNKYVK